MRIRVELNDDSVAHLASLRTPTRIARGGKLFAGPVWLNDALIWSDVIESRVFAWDAQRGPRVWIDPSHHQNGHGVDRQGRLIAASHGERAILRRDSTGRWRIIADLFDGKRFNSPSDVALAGDGAVWFVDPLTGLVEPDLGFGGDPEVDGQHIYRVPPDGLRGAVRAMTATSEPMMAPTGLAFAPDESALYVTDSRAGGVVGFVVRYGLEGPELGRRWVVWASSESQPSGITTDPAGRIWVATATGVHILAAPAIGVAATQLGRVVTPQPATGVAIHATTSDVALTTTDKVYLVPFGDLSR